jgi:hypothetical protein
MARNMVSGVQGGETFAESGGNDTGREDMRRKRASTYIYIGSHPSRPIMEKWQNCAN